MNWSNLSHTAGSKWTVAIESRITRSVFNWMVSGNYAMAPCSPAGRQAKNLHGRKHLRRDATKSSARGQVVPYRGGAVALQYGLLGCGSNRGRFGEPIFLT